jgi:preprotein translocase subunit Sec63
MADVEDEIELTLLVPLGFILLSVWTASWGRSVIHFVRGTTSANGAPASAAPAAEKKNSKGKGKKGAAVDAPEASVEITPKASASLSDKWKAIAILAAWALFGLFLASDYGMGKVSTGRYDPYKILGVPESIPKNELKKLYRDLSKEYHPDRLSGKPESERLAAEKRFVQISRAYKTLTTEEMMNNWIQYGHPDGPRSLSISTGLPSWMKKQENAWFIMLFYLGVFGGVGYLIKRRLEEVFAEPSTEKAAKKN